MSRFFIELVIHKGEYTVNLFEFDGYNVTQRTTLRGEQSAVCSSINYDKATRKLTFFARGAQNQFADMTEVSEDLGLKIIEDKNWTNLSYGLSIKSERTLSWLKSKGVRSKLYGR